MFEYERKCLLSNNSFHTSVSDAVVQDGLMIILENVGTCVTISEC